MKYLLAVTALAASPAWAQQCAPHDVVVAALAEKYGETLRVIAVDKQGAVVEFYGADSGSWTIAVTAPGGLTCFAAAGEYFEAVSAPPAGEDS